ncbi:MAG: hypothetical protein Q9194_000008 [Teloschistes cf. exilis]
MEIRSSGSRNLLVFDPSFKPSPGIQRSIGNKIRTSAPEKLLKAYRRGDHYLSKHSTFELLKFRETSKYNIESILIEIPMATKQGS